MTPFPLIYLSNLFAASEFAFETILLTNIFSKRNNKVCYYFFYLIYQNKNQEIHLIELFRIVEVS